MALFKSSCRYIRRNAFLFCNRNILKATKVAEKVEWIGYHDYDGGSAYGCVHVMKDGTAYVTGTTRKVEFYEKPENTAYLKSGRPYFNEYYSDSQEMNRLQN